jgi:predicted ester cyclase
MSARVTSPSARTRCTPAREFAGIPTSGRRVQFAEHVFYRFRDRRIEQVWSLIGTNAIRGQLT